jgi:hypothetical protein
MGVLLHSDLFSVLDLEFRVCKVVVVGSWPDKCAPGARNYKKFVHLYFFAKFEQK